MVNRNRDEKKAPVLETSVEMEERGFNGPPGRNFEDPCVEYISASFND